MFTASIKSKTIKNIIDSVSDLSQSIVFHISEDGMSAQTMDSSHVSVAMVKINAGGFDNFSTDKNYSVGVNILSMSKILKFASSDTVMTMTLVDEDKMGIVLKDESSMSEFEMGLMDIETDVLDIPKIDHECKIEMPCVRFQKVFKDLAQMGEDCEIHMTDDTLSFGTKGDALKAKSVFTQKDDMEFSGNSLSSYSIRYFLSFAKASPLCKIVKMGISDGMPILISFDMGEVGYVQFYLAPKISDEENEEDEEM